MSKDQAAPSADTPSAPSAQAAAPSAKAAARLEGKRWEERQPPAQRWVNRFCENWIFAFIVAMAIRHFALEAYQIPTASMEPILHGDGAFGKADYVVVDKLLFRFTGADRWGVTVFQFPWPEVAGARGIQSPDPAWDETGERSDNFPFNPLMNRNFVKRCVVNPGDEFYIRGGDIFLRQEDGSWQVSPKPDSVQNALWMPIYRQGAQAGNDRWESAGGASYTAEGQSLRCRMAEGGSLKFDQPLWNLYLKPGPINVGRSEASLTQVDVSMLEPRFSVAGMEGSVWDLNRWQVHRLTTQDLDSDTHGASLNQRMNEWVGDFRIGFTLGEVSGEPVLALREGGSVEALLALRPDGWSLRVDGIEAASASGDPTGAHFELINLDNRVQVLVDGEAVGEPVAVAATDPSAFDQRTSIRWEGAGEVLVEDLGLDRDVHYCSSGFLADETEAWKRPPKPVHKRNLVVMREQMIAAVTDQALRERLQAELAACLDGKRSYDWLKPIGNSPETSLTAPAGGHLLMGDNSPFSWDGRNWGWVPDTNLRGQVLVAALLPLGRWKLVR